MNSKHTSGLKRKASDKLETVSVDEFLRRLGPGGRRDWSIGLEAPLIFLKHMNAKTLLRQLATTLSWEAEGTFNTKSSQDMDNIRKIGRLMERVEALEAENRALKKKNSELEDKQAKVVKLLTDD
ncbi:hypothetical protein FOYG_11585 [Fusarium oxysporum NRRL 32931]|uniref:Uncharacterized protein n=1 Tax=Fusarium oxysporum NRRL 32931 TaxID=660029 RepID=W9I281_FUSOX|nr:hypothetical protein FOYG_11585 [Fusarium oxysporum NRRL 32931]